MARLFWYRNWYRVLSFRPPTSFCPPLPKEYWLLNVEVDWCHQNHKPLRCCNLAWNPCLHRCCDGYDEMSAGEGNPMLGNRQLYSAQKSGKCIFLVAEEHTLEHRLDDLEDYHEDDLDESKHIASTPLLVVEVFVRIICRHRHRALDLIVEIRFQCLWKWYELEGPNPTAFRSRWKGQSDAGGRHTCNRPGIVGASYMCTHGRHRTVLYYSTYCLR